jgi:MutS-like protein
VSDPAAEYARRLQLREADVARLERWHIWTGNLRLLVFAAGALLLWLYAKRHALSGWWLFLPLAAFVALVVYHETILRRQAQARRAAEFYRKGLNRIADKWIGQGETGERFRDPEHVYCEDLDLFGRGSLFELLSRARTRMGEQRLADWLLHPADVGEILARQEAVTELREKLDLGEWLAMLGQEAQAGLHPDELTKWAERRTQVSLTLWRSVSLIISVLFLASAVWVLRGGNLGWMALAIGLAAAVLLNLRAETRQILAQAETALADLPLLASILERLESEQFQSARLQQLAHQLSTGAQKPSAAINQLQRLAEFLEARDNVILRVLDVPVLYTVQVALALESWRRREGADVRRWIEAIGDAEALLSLSAYAYEHPADPFPEFSSESPMFAGEMLGHPLLPNDRCVRNSVRLGKQTQVLIVSGSNMSGKSTLLRTIGINTVLGMAGAPVRAARLLLSPLAIGASIRVNDSLQGGSSRFYAEITRLRKIADEASGPIPLLFLLDELLQGTNSHDRAIGAEGLLRTLVERGAIGLVTTHDLALTAIGEILGDNVHNVHFQDHLEGGKISFDYKLREGVVTKSNGLELMRSIGLNV